MFVAISFLVFVVQELGKITNFMCYWP